LVHWPLMGGLLHLVQRGGDWAGPQPAQAPPRGTKCNSPPINGQCTNHCIAIWWSVALQFNMGIKGLRRKEYKWNRLWISNSSVSTLRYNGRLIGSRIWSIKWRHVQWSWTTSNQDFKVKPLFDPEYLRNCKRWRRSYDGILIGTYTRPARGCHSDVEWLSKIFSDTKHLAASLRQLSFL